MGNHPQSELVFGLERQVDTGIAPYADWLNMVGVVTHASCQASFNRADENDPHAVREKAWISFTNLQSMADAMDQTAWLAEKYEQSDLLARIFGDSKVGKWEWSVHFAPTSLHQTGTRRIPRGGVRFEISDLEILNELVKREFSRPNLISFENEDITKSQLAVRKFLQSRG